MAIILLFPYKILIAIIISLMVFKNKIVNAKQNLNYICPFEDKFHVDHRLKLKGRPWMAFIMAKYVSNDSKPMMSICGELNTGRSFHEKKNFLKKSHSTIFFFFAKTQCSISHNKKNRWLITELTLCSDCSSLYL